MALVRVIGRAAMSGLVINYIVGSSIFGLPSELSRLLGHASPLAMIVGAMAMVIIMACAVEVGSQFSESGGFYLYVRRAFGPFAGLQVAWFWLLAMAGGVAASANLFIAYLGGIVPGMAQGWRRGLTMAVLIAVPTAFNYVGVRSGARLSSVLAVAKLLPLGLLILLGLGRLGAAPELIQASDITAPGWAAWLTAMLFVMVAYGGWEDALVPMGEVKEPRSTMPFSLAAGLLAAVVVYTLLQFVTIATIGLTPTDRPLALVAAVLIGGAGAVFVAVAAMLSTYGYISAALLSAPRLPYSLAVEGDCPPFLAALHPRFHTPARATLLFALVVWTLAVSGTFLWVLALAAASMMIIYGGVCAALIRLRRLQPAADALRVPFGRVLAAIGIAICVRLVLQLDLRQALLMLLTASIATANWAWAARQAKRGRWQPAASAEASH